MSCQEQTPPPTIYQPAPLSPATIDAQSVNINMGKNEPIVDFPDESPVKPNQQSFKSATAPDQPETPDMFLDQSRKPIILSSVELDNANIEPYLINVLGDYGINVIMDMSKKKNNADGSEAGKCSVSLRLKDVPLWGTVRQIMTMCGLWYDIDNNTFHIRPQDKVVEIKRTRPIIISEPYRFKYLQVTSHLNDNYLRVTGEIKDKETTGKDSVKFSIDDLQNLVKTLLSDPKTVSEPPAVTINESTNTIIIKDEPDTVANILRVLKDLDQPSPQIKIQAWIIETSSSVAKSIGVRWSGKFTFDNGVAWGNSRDLFDGPTGAFNYPLQAISQGIYPPTGKPDADGWAPPYSHETTMTPYSGDLYSLGMGVTTDAGSLVAEMQALESNGDIHILSQPELTVQDNREATITSGRDLNVRISTTETIEVKTIPAKLIATITPHVSPEGTLMMRITLQNRYPDIKAVDGIPEIIERSIDTTLLVKNRETIVLGGLKVEKDNRSTDGVPLLKDIPLLGSIFRYEESRKDADELLLIVRPTIISTNTKGNQPTQPPVAALNHAGIRQ
jgi:type II secretory pathway component HofQ